MFYFVRKNLSFAMPEMEHSLGISKTTLGIYLTAHGVIYGISKFLNGIVGEDAQMNAQSLPQVKMPNRDGFISDWPVRPR